MSKTFSQLDAEPVKKFEKLIDGDCLLKTQSEFGKSLVDLTNWHTVLFYSKIK